MPRTCWPLLLLLWTPAARAELEIRDIQACYGPLGPARPTLEYYPNDAVVLRYVVTGARVDADGQLDAGQTVTVTDPRGKVVFERKSVVKAVPVLGGQTFSLFTQVTLGDRVARGNYTLAVVVNDNVAAATASFQRRFTVKPSAFAIVAPEFFLDPDYTLPGPAAGVVGQTLHFRIRVIGFDRSKGKIDTLMVFEARDAEGNTPLARPTRVAYSSDDEAVVRKTPFVSFVAKLVLNRAGNFRLLVTVTDRSAKQTTRWEVPLRVREP